MATPLTGAAQARLGEHGRANTYPHESRCEVPPESSRHCQLSACDNFRTMNGNAVVLEQLPYRSLLLVSWRLALV
jgi:hypothetical protein